MSEGMFMGRKFTIPYDTSSDKQVASMMRAQIVTRTATPGTVIQVGDTVMAYGVTPDQAKMGNLDINLRSFEQISNQAQDAVRRNIQWQYGEQVADSSQPVTEPIKKSWIRRLFGAVKTAKPGTKLYGDVPEYRAGELAEPSVFAPKAAPAPASEGGADRIKQAKNVVKKPEAAPSKPAKAPKASKSPKPAKAAQAAEPSKATAAPKKSAVPTPIEGKEIAPHERMNAGTEMEFVTAFSTLARRHKAARPEWTVTREFPDDHTSVSTAVHPTGNVERHVLSYDPGTKKISHTFMPAHEPDHVVTHFDKHDDMHAHVHGDHEKWAF